MVKDKIIKRKFDPLVGMVGDYNIKISKNSEKITKKLEKFFGHQGKMLYGSKSFGHDQCKKKGWQFIPNANIFLKDGYKVWYGDFIINPDNILALDDLGKESKSRYYVLREMDGRFLDSPPTNEYLEEKSIYKTP